MEKQLVTQNPPDSKEQIVNEQSKVAVVPVTNTAAHNGTQSTDSKIANDAPTTGNIISSQEPVEPKKIAEQNKNQTTQEETAKAVAPQAEAVKSAVPQEEATKAGASQAEVAKAVATQTAAATAPWNRVRERTARRWQTFPRAGSPRV